MRLFITTASTVPSIYEFAVYNDVPVTNLALTATASASSFWQNDPTYNASKANDDNLGTRWNAHATNAVNCWLALDFGAPTTFNKTVLLQYGDRVTGYEIQYWTGAAWATAFAGGQLGLTRIDTFAPVTASQVRFFVTASTNVPTIWEFQVFRDVAAPQSVVINEWQPLNNGIIADPKDGQYSSWFELYNPANVSVNLAGWYLSGNPLNHFQFQVPAGFTMPPGGYLLVWADNQPAQNTPFNGDLHVNFLLTNFTVIGLYNTNGEQMDLVNLAAATPGLSYGSRVDGDGTILETAFPTPRTSNTRIVARSIAKNFSTSATVIAFSGLPAAVHRVQASTNLTGGIWSDTASIVANPLGNFTASNPADIFPVRLFRAVSP